MPGFIDEFKRGYTGEDTQHYQVAGIQVKCSHCGGVQFDDGLALLNTAGLSFLGLDWANRNANLLICTRCGHVDWFLKANPSDSGALHSRRTAPLRRYVEPRRFRRGRRGSDVRPSRPWLDARARERGSCLASGPIGRGRAAPAGRPELRRR